LNPGFATWLALDGGGGAGDAGGFPPIGAGVGAFALMINHPFH